MINHSFSPTRQLNIKKYLFIIIFYDDVINSIVSQGRGIFYDFKGCYVRCALPCNYLIIFNFSLLIVVPLLCVYFIFIFYYSYLIFLSHTTIQDYTSEEECVV